jgi:threonine aldolase
MTQRTFASDNNAGVHPAILQAISDANAGHAIGYGDDPYTAKAIATFKQHLGDDIDVYFVFNGTAANVLGLKAMTESYHAIICTDTSHIHVDECGAPERFTGAKLLPCATPDGKLTIDRVKRHLHGIGVEHHVQPRVVSITQSTELGTLYGIDEIKALADFAHANGLLLHMDGARISNAAAALGLPFRAFTGDAGVDVLSFGGTKNGMMGGEAVVLFHSQDPTPNPSPMGRGVGNSMGRGVGHSAGRGEAEFKFIRKQGLQLASKMRYIAAQFDALLSNDLYLRNAQNANAMALRLADAVKDVAPLAYPTQVNAVFAVVPKRAVPALLQHSFFYEWTEHDDEHIVARWMCSWDTTEEDVDRFAAAVRRTLKG